MGSPAVPRQTSREVKRRVKADRLTPASPIGFRLIDLCARSSRLRRSRVRDGFANHRRSYAPLNPHHRSRADISRPLRNGTSEEWDL
jgi:hypothetical protein